jgi:Uncharacterized protein conserved in bacteria
MNAKALTRRVSELAEPLCAAAGISLWDVTFEKEGRGMVLTVQIDRPEGIFIEDCEHISRALDPLLDAPEFDSVPAYTLTVSSAGLERVLHRPEHFAWALGRRVDATFYHTQEGRSAVSGILLRRTEEETVLELDGAEIILKNTDLAQVRLHFEF